MSFQITAQDSNSSARCGVLKLNRMNLTTPLFMPVCTNATPKALDFIKLKEIGFDYISVSSGGILPKTNMKQKEAYRSTISKKIKDKSKIITTTSGLITKHETAIQLIKTKKLDFITIARTIIKNPSWIYKLSYKLKKKKLIPNQYQKIFN